MKNKKIIIPHYTHSAFRPQPSALSPQPFERGFTLVELAMVLVVLGLLIGLGASLIGPLTKQAKVVESKEAVKSAKAALRGYAVKNGFLPTTISPSGARALDAWGNPLSYYVATSLNGSGNACNFITTDRTIFECISDGTTTPCPTSNQKSNIAFIVYSNGQDANGAGTTTQPTAGPACPSGTCYWIRAQNSSDASEALPYDDIVQYATLDEIRDEIGCSFKITNQTLPDAKTGVPYSVTLSQSGGTAAYTWSVNTQTINTFGCAGNSYPITGSNIGLCLYRDTGILSSSTYPTQQGTYNFTVTLTDANTLTATQAFTLNVIDRCSATGVNILNSTGASRYFKRNAGGCSSAWATGTNLNAQASAVGGIQPGDSYTFYTNAACSTACTGYASMTYAQAQALDVNENCQILINATGFTCNGADN